MLTIIIAYANKYLRFFKGLLNTRLCFVHVQIRGFSPFFQCKSDGIVRVVFVEVDVVLQTWLLVISKEI